MSGKITKTRMILRCAVLFLAWSAVFGADTTQLRKEFQIKREPVFEFVKKPTAVRKDDAVTIAFETKGLCDVTVAIEDRSGRILRHLACGVLGPDAPAPFAKNTRSQRIIWDGKDDNGRYVAENATDYAGIRVRVSLGLRARFERHFLWSPHRRITYTEWWTPNLPAPLAAAPEGVYICDGNLFDHVRLFGHDGRYKRTIYPFPAEKLDKLTGVSRQIFPQTGKTLPIKGGGYESTMLTSGTTANGGYLTQLQGRGATAMAVRKQRIALAMLKLNRLSTDGSTGGLSIEGPATTPAINTTWCKGKTVPRSAALSSDGNTLYLAGFFISGGVGANHRVRWVQGVGCLDVKDGKTLKPFAGTLTGKNTKGGKKTGQFHAPVSVAVDPQGRVYVADHYNSRVQVFDPEGKHLKSISVPFPVDISIDQQNGGIYVFSWSLGSAEHGFSKTKPCMVRLGPFSKPEVLAEYPLPVRRGHGRSGSQHGLTYRAVLDPWAPEQTGPAVWMFDEPGCPPNAYRLDRKKKKLVKITDFDAMTSGAIAGRSRERLSGTEFRTRNWNNRMAADPVTGEVFVLRKGPRMWDNPLVFDPETGHVRVQKLPFPVDDMAFDMEGYAYLRALGSSDIVRYKITRKGGWREVPFDYGEERKIDQKTIISALPVPGGNLHQQGGIWVAPNGHIAVAYLAPKGWRPNMFPGRGGNTIVSIWDRHGKIVNRDAVQGIGYVDGIFLDTGGDLYMASDGRRAGYFSAKTGTLVKVRPGARIQSVRGKLPLPLDRKPDRPQETDTGWWQGVQWFYGGIGFTGKPSPGCHCPHYRPTQDYFARTFVPETQLYSIAVLDSGGNLLMRIGQYGNVDNGQPLVKDRKVKGWSPRSMGGDEVGLFAPAYLATHTDRRLYIADPGNMRVLSVKLDYHKNSLVNLEERK